MEFKGIVNLPDGRGRRVHFGPSEDESLKGEVLRHRGAGTWTRRRAEVLVAYSSEAIDQFVVDAERAMQEHASVEETPYESQIFFEGRGVFAAMFDGSFDENGQPVGCDRLKAPTITEYPAVQDMMRMRSFTMKRYPGGKPN